MTSAYEPGMIPQFERHDRMGKALKVAGVSSSDMADYVGVARETMSRYLSGKAPAPLAVVRVIALRTGVPFAWIQDGDILPRHDGPDQGVSLTGG
jgi:transcriptional regulator with XRE-family HTH domain